MDARLDGIGFGGRGKVELGELTHLAYVSVYPDTAPELDGAIDGALTRAGSTSADAYPETTSPASPTSSPPGRRSPASALSPAPPARRSTPNQS